jgi:hypothetical protein
MGTVSVGDARAGAKLIYHNDRVRRVMVVTDSLGHSWNGSSDDRCAVVEVPMSDPRHTSSPWATAHTIDGQSVSRFRSEG